VLVCIEVGCNNLRQMRDDSLSLKRKKPAWSACPVCSQDLSPKTVGSKPFYLDCPYCGAPLSFIWWQRVIMTTLGVGLAFGIPAACGLPGYTLLLVGALLLFPGLVQGISIYCRIFPSKYVKKPVPVTTLFQR
jgi:hypothetical protein